ncbi:MAG: hypothetical protein ACR2NN_10910 [Bryobacteraceae bacterium]
MTIDERLEAIAQSVELLAHDMHELQATSAELHETAKLLLDTAKQDGENIRALARIADVHERRITALEDGEARR